jgi:hypothetical protein
LEIEKSKKPQTLLGLGTANNLLLNPGFGQNQKNSLNINVGHAYNGNV